MRLTPLLALACALGLVACRSDPPCPPAEPIVVPGARVPVYEIRQEPIYEECKTPIWGEKTVPVFQNRCVPVTIKKPSFNVECEQQATLWHRTEQVQVGVRRVPACLGYRVEKVQVGCCAKRVLVGWRSVGPSCP